jgi:hypothetical protein
MKPRLVCPEELPRWGVDLSDRQRKRLEVVGKFPARVWVTERTYAYVEAELDSFVTAKILFRDNQSAAAA